MVVIVVLQNKTIKYSELIQQILPIQHCNREIIHSNPSSIAQ